MGDGGKGDYISPGSTPVSVSEIPDLIPTNLTDFGDSEGGGETSSESSSPTPGVGMSGVGAGIGAGSGTVVQERDDPGDDDEGDEQTQGDLGEPDPSDGKSEPTESDRETDDPDEQKQEDDEQEDDELQAMMVIQSDPWDNMGWGLYPIRLRIKEEYGDQVGIYDDLVPVREFDDPRAMKDRWERDSKRHKMPVNTSVWDDVPPESTELSNRAFAAARKQGFGVAAEYSRRLRVAAVVEGTNIEDEEELFNLAEDVGLDIAKLREDWAGVELKATSRDSPTTKTFVHADDETMEYDGYVHVDDLKMIFEQAGLDEEEPQPLRGFVREHGPVTVNEVMFVYGYESKQAAIDELQELVGVVPVRYGTTTFWTETT